MSRIDTEHGPLQIYLMLNEMDSRRGPTGASPGNCAADGQQVLSAE